MAPRGLGPASYFFALGIMLVEMLTGQTLPEGGKKAPWERIALAGRVPAGLQVLAATRSDVPVAVWPVAQRALSADSAARFANADELCRALESVWAIPVSPLSPPQGAAPHHDPGPTAPGAGVNPLVAGGARESVSVFASMAVLLPESAAVPPSLVPPTGRVPPSTGQAPIGPSTPAPSRRIGVALGLFGPLVACEVTGYFVRRLGDGVGARTAAPTATATASAPAATAMDERQVMSRVLALSEAQAFQQSLNGTRFSLTSRVETRPEHPGSQGTSQCRWGIYVGTLSPENSSVWNRFEVDAMSGEIWVWDAAEDTTIPLETWRLQSRQ